MGKRLTATDKRDIIYQLEWILRPSKVVDTAFDTKRMCVYAAVAYHSEQGGNYLPDGHIFGIVAPIYDADDDDREFLGYNFIVTSDEMPSESMGIAEMPDYCHCPVKILKKLSAPKNEWAMEWREVCFKNSRRKSY